MQNKAGILIVIAAGIALCDWFTLTLGWWWITLILGLLSSVLVHKGRTVLPLSFSSGVLGWGLPLLFLALHAPMLKVAGVVESIIGMSDTNGWVIVILTVLLGGILSLLGAWVGVAALQVIACQFEK